MLALSRDVGSKILNPKRRLNKLNINAHSIFLLQYLAKIFRTVFSWLGKQVNIFDDLALHDPFYLFF